MKILVTGAKGFVGRNLCAQLKNIRDGKAKWYNLPEPVEGIRVTAAPLGDKDNRTYP